MGIKIRRPRDLSFCANGGHAHSLARGLPMAKAPGEPMRREDGLSCGQGLSKLMTWRTA